MTSIKSGLDSISEWIISQLSSMQNGDESLQALLLHKKDPSSIAQFYLDASHSLSLLGWEKELLGGMKTQLIQQFPWFEITSALSDREEEFISIPFGMDHLYASSQRKPPPSRALNNHFCSYKKTYALKSHEDSRRCGFCGSLGDSSTCGRLLPMRQGDAFVHSNCALWSSEVIESPAGGLQYVSQALCRSAKMTCSFCGDKGASMGCSLRNCPSNYHFPCGLQDGAAIKVDKSVYCQKHALAHAKKENTADLRLECFLYVDHGRESRRKTKCVDLNKVSLQVGSLTVENIGHFSSELDSAIPVGFKCSRLFWSVNNPRKIVKYYCQTRLVKKKSPGAPEPSFCFNHEKTPIGEFGKSLSKFNRCLFKWEMKKRNWGPIMHPYAALYEWPNISSKDPHHPSKAQHSLWKYQKNASPFHPVIKARKHLPFKRYRFDSTKKKKKARIMVLKENAPPLNNSSSALECLIPQVDGASDDLHQHPVCPKCKLSLGGDWSLYEAHVSACNGAPKRHSDAGYPEVAPPKTPREQPHHHHHAHDDSTSPRKDFSIEGLLSPPEREGPEEEKIVVDGDEEDDIVILSQTRRSKPPKASKKKMMRKGNSAPSLKNHPPAVAPQGSSLNSRPGLHHAQGLLTPPSYPLMGSLLQQPYASPYAAATYSPQALLHPPPQYSYVTPAGYIFNQNSFFPPQQTPAIYFSQQAAYSQNVFGYTLPPHPQQPHSAMPPNPQPSVPKSKKKIARVHPQPVINSASSTPPSSSTSSHPGSGHPSLDPIKALTNMLPSRQKQHSSSAVSAAAFTSPKEPPSSFAHELSLKAAALSESERPKPLPASSLPSPLTEIDSKSMKPINERSQTPLEKEESRPSSTASYISNCSSIEESVLRKSLANGAQFSFEASKEETSIEIVLQRKESKLRVQEVSIKDSLQCAKKEVNSKAASELLKQLKASKKKQRPLAFLAFKNEVINELEANAESRFTPKLWRPRNATSDLGNDGGGGEYKVLYELSSEDGFKAVSTDVNELWKDVFESVQDARLERSLGPLPNDAIRNAGQQMLGLTHSALSFLLEQLGDEARPEDKSAKSPPENPSGCARTEVFKERSPLDMFSWLASKHRKKPNLSSSSSKLIEFETISGHRRATTLDLPLAMRFRHLPKNAKEAVGVFSSGIHGRGLYCKREIQEGEMVIEYAGEEIRAVLTDMREKYYESRGIGCYMFRVDDNIVIDATLKGNAARFINHCCDPNCYSKIVDIVGKKHIIIFALRTIVPGEELTYDYKFPIEDVKLPCTCGKKKCRKYMN